MKKINLFVPLLVLLISGCATNPIAAPPPQVPVTTTVILPPQLLEDCKDLPKLDKASYTEEELIQVMSDWSKTNTSCKANHKALVNVVKQAFDIDPVTHVATPVTQK